MKAVLISTGFVAMAMHLKVIVPVAVDFSQAPILLGSFLTWLKPPYLYVLTNVIIIVIGVSSRYYRIAVTSHDGKDYEVSYSSDYKFQTDHHEIVQQAPLRRRTETKDVEFSFVAANSQSIIVKEPEVVYEEKERLAEAAATVEEEEKRCLVVVTKSENQPPAEKPLVSARIGQRKLFKVTPAGNIMQVRYLIYQKKVRYLNI